MRKNLIPLSIFIAVAIPVSAQTPISPTTEESKVYRGPVVVGNSVTPKPASSAPPKTVSGGVLNGKAISLPVPAYPPAARAVRSEGPVAVKVLIDEQGNVESASAVSGHPLLRGAAVAAAKSAKFPPTLLSGQPVKVSGVITYIFAGELDWGRIGRTLSRAENGEDVDSDLLVAKAKLPDDFESEKNEIELLRVGRFGRESDQGALNAQATKIIETIQNRLLGNPVDSWRFNFKVAMGRVRAGINDDAKLSTNLAKLLELVNAVPHEAVREVTEGIKDLAVYSGRTSFTEEDRKNILQVTDPR